MQFTGNQLSIKRKFYSQTGNLGVSVDLTMDNTTGYFTFGISGDNSNIQFVLNSGYIYQGNDLIGSYNQYRQFSIESQLASGNYNIIKDGIPLVFGKTKTTGEFKYFYITRQDTTTNPTIGLYVSGDNIPNYYIQTVGYLINSGQTGVTGNFINNGQYPISIFNSEIATAQNYYFSPLSSIVSGNKSGIFSFGADYDSVDTSVPILTTFNTDFGDISILFSIIDARSYNMFVLLGNVISYNFNNSGILNITLPYANYSGGFVSNKFNTDMGIYLSYISGSGSFSNSSYATGVRYSTTIYGNILYFGNLTGTYTTPTGDSTITGNYIINLTMPAYATGAATGFFSGNGTGLASGIGYTGFATSAFTGIVTGFIYGNSGSLQINSILTGTPILSYSIAYPSYINATGYINISQLHQNDYFYIGSLTAPLVKGLQFNNETGLIYYLSGHPIHQTFGYINGSNIILTSQLSGTLGNGIPISIGNCDYGTLTYTPFLTGGTNIGTTGNIVYPIGPYSGYISTIITGSGYYAVPVTGTGNGILYYTKTFTGEWDIFTGLSGNAISSVKASNTYNSNMISGLLNLQPNSSIVIQVVHNSDGRNIDSALLTISGAKIINPINQILIN